MMYSWYIKGAPKVIGYFSHTLSGVFCDGDACIIAASEELMKLYLQKRPSGGEEDIIKKTRFGEVMDGLRRGGAYAFDEGAYERFLDVAKLNGIDEQLPEKEFFSEPNAVMHFIRIQVID